MAAQIDSKATKLSHLTLVSFNDSMRDDQALADKRTQMVFAGESPKGFPSGILKVARRKLKMVDAAVVLAYLRVPPGNQLEALTGDRRGQHKALGTTAGFWLNLQTQFDIVTAEKAIGKALAKIVPISREAA